LAALYHTAVLLLQGDVNDGRRRVCVRTCAAAVTGSGGTTFTAALMSKIVVRIRVRAAAAIAVLGGTMYTTARTLDDVRAIPHQSIYSVLEYADLQYFGRHLVRGARFTMTTISCYGYATLDVLN